MKNLFVSAFLIATLIASCGGSKFNASSPLFANEWLLTELYGNPVQISNTAKDAHINFVFDGMSTAGSSGCNRFNGAVVIDGKKMKFGNLASTRMACMDMAFEAQFLEMMKVVESYSLADDILTFKDGRGKAVASFRKKLA